ncbi:XRE family transcriptional regulator [Treponema sp.]|uniref:helix-turn-helix domain-containing protein n=1 Tax=Treponema sp. TaxID=166 RepID=UPI0026005E99|nr:XRE family transcriptional regulator [Treponema sp.]MCR5217551.1 XRE family transcriptional regulator [Treponema sp.]
MGIGKQLKTLRKSKDITLADVAEKTDLSLGFLSNLERDQTSPTIDVLHKICNALDITLNDILVKENEVEEKTAGTINVNEKKESPEENIVRTDDRKILFQDKESGLSYSSMTKGATDFKVSAMTISGDQLYQFSKHEHDELGIVISGSLEIQIEEKSYFLYPGDSIYIKAGTMHYGRKTSEESCISYWTKLSTELNDLKKERL